MREKGVQTNRVFVPGIYTSPRKSEMEKEKEKRCARKNNFAKGRSSKGAIRETAGWISVNFGLYILYTLKVLNTLVMDGLG